MISSPFTSLLRKKLFNFNKFKKSYNVNSLLKDFQPGVEIELKGWIANVRKQKQYIFLDINDGTTPQRLQVVIPSNLNINIKDLTAGSSIVTRGCLEQSPKGSIELQASEVKIVTDCKTENGYPFAPRKQYSHEYVRQYLHLRSKTKSFSSLLRIRSAASFAFHNFFREEGFVNIHTPILTSNDCEGAGEAFKVIPENENLLKNMTKSNIPADDIFFGKKSYLTVSGQLHLESALNGLGKVYTFGPTFRAENSKSRFHLSEFYMIEAEIPFLEELVPLLRFTERLLKKVTENLIINNMPDIQNYKSANTDEFSWINKEFPIITYKEAMKILQNNASQFEAPVSTVKGPNKEHEIFLVNYVGNIPLFIIDWPKDIKPFYMKENINDTSCVSAFDLLAPGIGEIVGGSLREDNLLKLKENVPDQANLSWYFDSRRFGGVPTGGFGLGFERYLQFLLQIDNIKDSIPFPRWPHNCSM